MYDHVQRKKPELQPLVVLDVPMCRGAATLGGAGCAHVSAHGAIECSVWGNFLASDTTRREKQ